MVMKNWRKSVHSPMKWIQYKNNSQTGRYAEVKKNSPELTKWQQGKGWRFYTESRSGRSFVSKHFKTRPLAVNYAMAYMRSH